METVLLKYDNSESLRSKLYLLDEVQGWIDHGTGKPIILKNEVSIYILKIIFMFSQNNQPVLKFITEQEDRLLYELEINDDIIFEKQEG